VKARTLGSFLVVAISTIGCPSGTSTSSLVGVEVSEQAAALGLVRADQATTHTVQLTKPLVPAAEVELVEVTGSAFAPAENALPVTAGSGVVFDLPVAFTPPPGPAPVEPVTGKITVRFVSPGNADLIVDVMLSAIVEQSDIELVTETLSFGKVAVGEVAESTVVVHNPNISTPVTVTGVADPDGSFGLGDSNLFPRVLPPGGNLAIAVTFGPAAPGLDASSLRVENDVKAPLRASLDGEGMPGELVIHDRVYLLNGGLSDIIEIDVPAEAISMNILALDELGGLVDIVSMTGPDGSVYTDNFSGPWIWSDGFPAGFDGVLAAQLPNSDVPEVQLFSGGGTYEMRFATYSSATKSGLFVVVEQRSRGLARTGRIPVAVFVGDGLPLDETTAAADPKLSEAIATMDVILAQIGLRIGDVTYHKLTDASWDVLDSGDLLADMLQFGPQAATPAPPMGRLNLYFINEFGGSLDGVIGIAGATPGFKIDETPYAGVAMGYDDLDAFTLGSTAAHEVGHFLALEHTVEDDGSFFGIPDFIDDTLWCLPVGVDEICPIEGANYLMHWADLGRDGIVVTRGQGQVMLRNVMVEPGHPASTFSTRAGIPTPALRQSIGQAILRTKQPLRCANCAGTYPARGRSR